jgi:hypothetical protein
MAFRFSFSSGRWQTILISSCGVIGLLEFPGSENYSEIAIGPGRC